MIQFGLSCFCTLMNLPLFRFDYKSRFGLSCFCTVINLSFMFLYLDESTFAYDLKWYIIFGVTMICIFNLGLITNLPLFNFGSKCVFKLSSKCFFAF